MLVGLNSVTSAAAGKDYAIPAFNVFGYEDAISVVRAAEALRTPVILAANIPALAHMPLPYLAPLLLRIAEQASVPVCIHLDHGKSFEYVMNAIKHGFPSVMFDGSQLPFEDNVRITKDIVKAAHAFGVDVEAEIGSVGYSDPSMKMKHEISSPDEVEAFVKETGVDAVAVSVGTLHRMEDQSANIDFGLLERIQSKVDIPLVIHGATGVPDEQLKQLIKYRVGKINIGTALRMSFGRSLRETINASPSEFDRIKWFAESMIAVQEAASRKLQLLGCKERI
ncbi:class II fructose-bisphosphate aldolase [Paenibacillus ferrarius]|uniref:class II fructose-bisphosphate aldolase n=1 Tax=Paenibacillus ferrarius TaxID=1469647 RepID=UPI003D2D804B